MGISLNVVGFARSRAGLGVAVLLLGAGGALAAARIAPTRTASLGFVPVDPVVAPVVPPPGVVTVWSTCPDVSAPEYFFPSGTFARDDHSRHWNGDVLTAMQEKPLWCGTTGAEESYRFLLLQSRHGPIGVRVERSGPTVRLLAVYLISPWGGSIADRTDIVLQGNEWDALVGLLRAAHFWEISTTSDDMGADGQEWTIEGRKDGRYRVVRRYCPGCDDEVLGKSFAEAGIRFLELAKMRTLASEI